MWHSLRGTKSAFRESSKRSSNRRSMLRERRAQPTDLLNLAHVIADEARSEIAESKRKIETKLGDAVDHFSYPHPALNPQWSPQTLGFTRDAGFQSAERTRCGPVRRGDEPLALRRIYPANDFRQWKWNLECTFLGRQI